MKKKKSNSTQRKYFGTIPRSEFYGFVLGYAMGLFLTGFLRLETQFQEILFALVGLGIGYYIDIKYYQAPNEPEGAGADDTAENTADEVTGAASDESEEITAEEAAEIIPYEPQDLLPEEAAEKILSQLENNLPEGPEF